MAVQTAPRPTALAAMGILSAAHYPLSCQYPWTLNFSLPWLPQIIMATEAILICRALGLNNFSAWETRSYYKAKPPDIHLDERNLSEAVSPGSLPLLDQGIKNLGLPDGPVVSDRLCGQAVPCPCPFPRRFLPGIFRP